MAKKRVITKVGIPNQVRMRKRKKPRIPKPIPENKKFSGEGILSRTSAEIGKVNKFKKNIRNIF